MGDFLYSRALEALVALGDLDLHARADRRVHAAHHRRDAAARGGRRAGVHRGGLRDAHPGEDGVAAQRRLRDGRDVRRAAASRRRCARYGERLGMAFQVADDILDYTETASVTGKPSGLDLKEHKVTLPLIAALPRLSRAGAGARRGAVRRRRARPTSRSREVDRARRARRAASTTRAAAASSSLGKPRRRSTTSRTRRRAPRSPTPSSTSWTGALMAPRGSSKHRPVFHARDARHRLHRRRRHDAGRRARFLPAGRREGVLHDGRARRRSGRCRSTSSS